MINGRVCLEFDNFTRVHTTGSSVVDYICTFQNNVEKCKYFKVHLTRPLLNKIGIYTDKIPDHSVLELNILSHFIGETCNIYDDTNHANVPNVSSSTSENIDDISQRLFRQYNIRNMPGDFLRSDTALLALMPLSHQITNEIRSHGGKKIAKVAMKCNNFYYLGDYNKTTY